MRGLRGGTLLFGVMWGLVAHAMSWQDWWITPDHQAEKYMKNGQYAEATKLFQRKDWRATAAYRAQDYQQAAQDFLALQTVEGYYNAGNALAMAGHYQQALAAYHQALQREPKHADAIYNHDIVKKLLDQQKQSQANKNQQSQSQDGQKNQSSDQKQNNAGSPKTNPSASADANAKSQSKSTPKSEEQPPQNIEKQATKAKPSTAKPQTQTKSLSEREQQQAKEQWLRLIPDDPAYLLRQKFLRDHVQRQNGESI
jgi:Ca-activated chloride channel family protein